ncbi:MAG: type II toxin-antitoxin system VapC family toxin [Clostridiales Family XIII bacterium]|nr:type II toxin-antitoxin system VapC family toxin [Clostridiales Family XIII bacterium]
MSDGYLFDTHCLLWQLNGDARISKKAKALLERPKEKKYASIASVWEVAVKISIEKLAYQGGVRSFFEDIVAGGLGISTVSIDVLEILEKLPYHHRDPFDRILVATAMAENYAIVTADDRIKEYPVKIVW